MANTDLTGASWVATFTYDKTLGGFQSTDGSSFDRSSGGSNNSNGSPIIASAITIKGVSRTILGQFDGQVYTASTPRLFHLAVDVSDNGFFGTDNELILDVVPVSAPGSLDQNFGPVAATVNFSFVQFYTYDALSFATLESASADLGTDVTYSVSDPLPDTGAVPEPASWALMIAGFGLVGAAQRRVLRRRMVAATA
ncbi:PEP-CTERM sorting domain-containing protein [Polymorphobacter arshaanensis]|uniref:PEP-CTERM sorting domain-containing protein n=2 Tax=Glacieibacterium arshaanense TaxID=2511025 RepID=A0A4Y9EP35_9SPHN|nr:PEP-CTERM sorting domain-containing protein [Polymorphobacter arshaanensis]